MLLAEHDGQRIRAAPGTHGSCPSCGEDLTPKCGSIVIWHWSHKNHECRTRSSSASWSGEAAARGDGYLDLASRFAEGST
jgi:hypothetical protein